MHELSTNPALQAPQTLIVSSVPPTPACCREVVKAGVFRPDHILPTMTLEEFAEREVWGCGPMHEVLGRVEVAFLHPLS